MNKLALTIMIIGALNWGLVGTFNFDAVAWLLGSGSIWSRMIYILVALAGCWGISMLFRRNVTAEEV